MPIEVELPDGTIAEFPDGTSNQTMEMALAKYRAPKVPANPSTPAKSVRPERSLMRRAAVNLFGDYGADALDSVQHNLLRPLHGAAQFVEHGVNAAANAVLPAPQQTLSGLITGQAPQPQGLGQRLRQSINESTAQTDRAMQDWEADYQARNPDNAGTAIGATIGGVAPFLYGGGARLLQGVGGKAAGLLPATATTSRAIASGAAQGAAIGLMQPVMGNDYASEKAQQVGLGSLTGGALPAGIAAGAGIGRGAWRAVQPIVRPQQVANQQLGRLLGADQSTLAQLERPFSALPGEVPTTAQILQTPRAVQVEKALANRPELKTGFIEQANATNAARMNVLRGIAGTDDELQTAIQARRDAAAPFRKEMLPEQGSQLVDVTGVKQTLDMLAKSANSAVRAAAKEHLSILKANADESGKVPAYTLDDIRQNVGGMLAKHAPQGMAGNAETAKYAPVSSKIIRTLEREIPGYRDYLAAYRENSAPINTMEATRKLLAASEQRGLNSAGDARLTLAQLNTGLGRIDRSRFGVTPAAKQQLEGLRESLQRESVSNSVTSPGSDTAYNLASDGWLAGQIYGSNMQGPGGLARGVATGVGALLGANSGGPVGAAFGAGIGSALKTGADRVNQRIAQRVAAGMQNPQEAARMVRSFLEQNRADAPRLLEEYPQWRAILGYEAGQLPQR